MLERIPMTPKNFAIFATLIVTSRVQRVFTTCNISKCRVHVDVGEEASSSESPGGNFH